MLNSGCWGRWHYTRHTHCRHCNINGGSLLGLGENYGIRCLIWITLRAASPPPQWGIGSHFFFLVMGSFLMRPRFLGLILLVTGGFFFNWRQPVYAGNLALDKAPIGNLMLTHRFTSVYCVPSQIRRRL